MAHVTGAIIRVVVVVVAAVVVVAVPAAAVEFSIRDTKSNIILVENLSS